MQDRDKPLKQPAAKKPRIDDSSSDASTASTATHTGGPSQSINSLETGKPAKLIKNLHTVILNRMRAIRNPKSLETIKSDILKEIEKGESITLNNFFASCPDENKHKIIQIAIEYVKNCIPYGELPRDLPLSKIHSGRIRANTLAEIPEKELEDFLDYATGISDSYSSPEREEPEKQLEDFLDYAAGISDSYSLPEKKEEPEKKLEDFLDYAAGISDSYSLPEKKEEPEKELEDFLDYAAGISDSYTLPEKKEEAEKELEDFLDYAVGISDSYTLPEKKEEAEKELEGFLDYAAGISDSYTPLGKEINPYSSHSLCLFSQFSTPELTTNRGSGAPPTSSITSKKAV